MPTPVTLNNESGLIHQVEAQGFSVNTCCGQGICGSCRATLISGEVNYSEQPVACLNANEIVLCCAMPKSNEIIVEL